MSSLNALNFRALLVALARRNFYDGAREGLGNEDLFAQLWGSDSDKQPEEVFAEIQSFEELICAAASSNVDAAKVVARSGMVDPHAKVLSSWWNNEREKIHDVLVRRSTWNEHFSKLSWRVDVKTVGSKSGSDANEPIALFELRTLSGNAKNQTQFELNRTGIQELMVVLGNVERALESKSY